MKSPFPGMDPYLEKHWGDIHHRLVTYSCDQLQGVLPGDLRARAQERIYLEDDKRRGRNMYPDVRVIESKSRSSSATAVLGERQAAEPFYIQLKDDPFKEGFIEIIDIGTGNKVVTVIEFLSLSNKLPGEGQKLYLRKQQELIEGRVSLVEIDLLRRGDRITLVREDQIPDSHLTHYFVSIFRGWQPSSVGYVPISLRERLPVIKIPLRETDTDAPLDLQILIELCYRNGRYDDLDYTREPVPPLEGASARWADELLREKGLRE